MQEIDEIENDMLATIISPVLRYAKTPNVWKYYLVELIVKKGDKVQSGELAMQVPLPKERFENLLRELSSDGWIEITIHRDRRYVQVSEEFYKQFYSTAPSEVGKDIVKAMVEYYSKNDYLILPGKATNGPDAIAIPMIGKIFAYDKAVAVEVETLLGEYDHVNHTLNKKSNKEIGRVHLWVPTDKLNVLKRVLSNDVEVELKIFATDGRSVHEINDVKEIDEVLSKRKVVEVSEESMQEFASLVETSPTTTEASTSASGNVNEPEEVPEDLKKCLSVLYDDTPTSENAQNEIEQDALREVTKGIERALSIAEKDPDLAIEVFREMRDATLKYLKVLNKCITRLEKRKKTTEHPQSSEEVEARSDDQKVSTIEENSIEKESSATEVRETATTASDDETTATELDEVESTDGKTESEREEKTVIDEIVSHVSDEHKEKFRKLLKEIEDIVELDRVKEIILEYIHDWAKSNKILPDRGIQGTFVGKTFAGETVTVNLGSEEKMIDYLGHIVDTFNLEENVLEQIKKYGKKLTLPDGREVKVLSRVEPDNPPLNYALGKVLEEIEKLLQRKEGLIDISNSTKFEEVRVLSISTFVKRGYMVPRKIGLYCLLSE